MFGISSFEMLIVGIVAIILFGNRLPSVARSLGKSLTEFKKGMREFESEIKTSVYSEPVGRVTYDKNTVRSAPSSETPATETPVAEVQHQ